MVADILIIAVIVIFMVAGALRGMAKTILNLAGVVVSAVAAYYVADFLSQLVYDTFFSDIIITNLEAAIKENGIEYATTHCFDALPSWIFSMITLVLAMFGTNIADFQKSLTIPESFAATTAETIEGVISPIVVTMFSGLLVIILFIVIFILVSKLIKYLEKVFEIPVIKQINQLLGGVLGAVEGVIIVWIAVNLFSAIMQFSSPELFDSRMVSGELFKFFCLFD